MSNTIDILKEHKLKVTSSRIAILNFLEKTNATDSSTILSYLDNSPTHIDRATVFRVLNTFKKAGIIRAIQLNENKFRYELTNRPEHHHIVCSICGKIADIEICIDEEMEKKITKDTGFIVNKHMLEFSGICSNCQK